MREVKRAGEPLVFATEGGENLPFAYAKGSQMRLRRICKGSPARRKSKRSCLPAAPQTVDKVPRAYMQ